MAGWDCAGGTEEDNSVVTSFGLHSGLRQGGNAFGVVFYGTAEAVPFRKVNGAPG